MRRSVVIGHAHGRRAGPNGSRRGFTLIELMIVVAVMVVLVGALFSINFRITGAWAVERSRQSLQQNFRFAGDTITVGVRGAVKVWQPVDNCMSDYLVYDYVVPVGSVVTHRRATFLRVAGSTPGTSRVEQHDVLLVDDGLGNWVPTGPETIEPVTEDISSLAALYFVHRGSRIISMFVAQYGSSDQPRTITYTMQTTIRVSVGYGS